MHSESTRKKISESHKGIRPSLGSRKKMSNAKKGKHLSEETRIKISNANKNPSYEKRLKLSISLSGRRLSQDTIFRMKIAHSNPSYDTRVKMGDAHRGNKSSTWNGGISFDPYCPKFTLEFRERVRAWFNFTCVECGTPQLSLNTKLHVHHVNFNKNTCCDGAIHLFVPLCQSCHSKTQKNRDYWKRYFTEIINIFYSGKCYFTKDEMKTFINLLNQ